MSGAQGAPDGSGASRPLPARLVHCQSAPVDATAGVAAPGVAAPGVAAPGVAGGALRERLAGDVSGAFRAAPTIELDAWLETTDLARALLAWFGCGAPRDKRLLLLALERDAADVDALLAEQLNAVLHTRSFQALEARWRGLLYLINAADQSPLARIRVLPVSWPEVARDLDRAGDFDRSQLFRKIYTEEFGTLGGEPFGMLIGDYEIQHRPSALHATDDIAALKSLAMIAAAAFAPIVMGAGPRLFQLDSFAELGRPFDLRAVFRHEDYARWRSMREMEEMRFLGLVLPRVLMRLPYRIDGGRRDGFRFEETLHGAHAGDYLWGNAAFAFGAVVLRAFANFHWFADIRGAARDTISGGLVNDLPVAWFTVDAPGIAVKPSMEALLSDTQEKDLADMGFIALRKIPFTDYSVFYSNQALQSAPRFDGAAANRNARLSAMLQYIICVSRFAHYVKMLGRRFIGTALGAQEIQSELQRWLMNYCLGNDDASLESKSRYPLREASVEVKEIPGKAACYSCVLFLRPHFQLDDIATGFKLVTQIAPAVAAA